MYESTERLRPRRPTCPWRVLCNITWVRPPRAQTLALFGSLARYGAFGIFNLVNGLALLYPAPPVEELCVRCSISDCFAVLITRVAGAQAFSSHQVDLDALAVANDVAWSEVVTRTLEQTYRVS
jgi:hypothetical protein